MSRYAEALLPKTDALTRSTVEYTTYRGKFLVRYRNRDGVTFRKRTPDRAEADQFYFECVNKLRQEARVR